MQPAICPATDDKPQTTIDQLFQHSQHVAFAQDHKLLPIHFHIRSRILPVVNGIPDAQPKLHRLSLVIKTAWPDRDHFPLRRLLLRRIRQQNPTLGLLLRLRRLDDHSILQWFQFHSFSSLGWALPITNQPITFNGGQCPPYVFSFAVIETAPYIMSPRPPMPPIPPMPPPIPPP